MIIGSFCRGEEVSQLVSERLQYRSLNEILFKEMRERYGLSEDKIHKSLLGSESILGKYRRERQKNITYLKTVLAELIQDDNQILQGPVSWLLPSTISHILRICIIANHDYRVRLLMDLQSKSEKDAHKQIRNDDENFLELTKYLFNKTPYDESLYDIVLPMHITSPEKAAETISDHALSEQVMMSPGSRQAAEDFSLCAAVNLALVEAGHDKMEIHADSGRVTILINEYIVRLKHLEAELTELAGKIPGVESVYVKTGPKFHAPSLNPWANIEIPPKILLVDDEKEYVHTLSERLETRDIGSSVVYNGEEALEFVEKDEPDVMVLDLMMPGIDGIEVLRRVKKEHPHIEVIILTGHGSEREEAIANDLGAFAYLQKPVNVDDLAKIMKEAYKKVAIARGAIPTSEEDEKD